MAHAYFHTLSSVNTFPELCFSDVYELHSKMDESKSSWTDQRHRYVLHHNLGIEILAKYADRFLLSSEIVRKLGKQHLKEDFSQENVDLIDDWWKSPNHDYPRKRRTISVQEHALMDAEDFGKRVGDTAYIHALMELNEFVDNTIPLPFYDSVFHSAFGIWLVEWCLGDVTTQSLGKHAFPVRTIAERHVMREYDRIPTVEGWGKAIRNEEWMGGKANKLSRRFV